MTRFVFITGGVISSLGKGLAAASLGALLKKRGFRVRLRKLDPYLNVDPGTLSPYQHGEVYVTDDGTETDLDLGHYERFAEVETTAFDYTTTGKIYLNVLKKERQGDYLGATVQIIPHITNEIKCFLEHETEEEDFVICEIGGTVGDIESLPFLEAARQFRQEKGVENVLFLHVALVPYIETVGESKTKPVQHSVKELQHVGIQPDVLLCRCDRPLSLENQRKLALFCNVPIENVIEGRSVKTIYQAPTVYHAAGLDDRVLAHFHLTAPTADLNPWITLCQRIMNPESKVVIAIVGKYVALQDAYKSLIQALVHAGAFHQTGIEIKWVDAEVFEEPDLQKNLSDLLDCVDGIIIPGGFGVRGIEGKIAAIQYARLQKKPCLGICLGVQLMVIEAARHLLDLRDANSSEFAVSSDVVVGLLTEWSQGGVKRQYQGSKGLGGTMRLGSYPAYLGHNTKAFQIYGQEKILERHRHRYEINMNYRSDLEKVGLIFSGLAPDGEFPEILERKDHPWFMGVQFHPELKSRPFNPHPLFVSFVEACLQGARGS